MPKGQYRAALCKLPQKNGYWEVTVLKDTAPEKQQAVSLIALIAAISLAGIAVLALFSYRFTRRAVAPVRLAHDKQNEFVSAASHELRSPLTVIRLSADTIQADPSQGPACAQKIEQECMRMSRLISDLLLLAGTDSQSPGTQKAPVSPQTILLTTYERFEAMAAQRDITLNVEVDASLPPHLYCDRQRIEQALAALMENALQYTPPKGTVCLRGRATRHQTEFIVEDSGAGISGEKKAAVFDRFYRGDSSRTDKEHYGLGLSIVQEIARQHKGSVSAGDSPLGGASFVLRLPQRPPGASPGAAR